MVWGIWPGKGTFRWGGLKRFTTATLSKPGGRLCNEDCLGRDALPDGHVCWVLADGLGGHHGGAIAAQTAVQAFIGSFRANPGKVAAEPLLRHLQAAHEAVLAQRHQQDQGHPLTDMRTTFVALVSDGVSVAWAHLGDSRLYCFRGGQVVVGTKDHSVPQALADAGDIGPEEIRGHEDRNRLLRDMGGNKGIRPTLLEAPWMLQKGDVFLLCTDGFWEPVPETAMVTELAKSASPSEWLAQMECHIQRAMSADQDNYTAIAIFTG